MLKQAIITYFKAFRYENLKKINRHGNVIAGFCILAIYPAIFGLINKSSSSMYMISLPLIPILLMIYGEILKQFMVTKEIFMVPMKTTERKCYVNALIWTKILVPTLIGALLLLVWKAAFDRRWLEVITLVFVYLSVEIGMGIRSEKRSYTPWNRLNFLVSAILFILMVAMEPSDYEMWGGVYVLLTILVVILMVLDLLILIRQYKGFIESICDYEKMS